MTSQEKARLCYFLAVVLIFALIGTGWLTCAIDRQWLMACILQWFILAIAAIGLLVTGNHYSKYR